MYVIIRKHHCIFNLCFSLSFSEYTNGISFCNYYHVQHHQICFKKPFRIFPITVNLFKFSRFFFCLYSLPSLNFLTEVFKFRFSIFTSLSSILFFLCYKKRVLYNYDVSFIIQKKPSKDIKY